MKNNLKQKISILFVVILMILSTLLACNVLAEELEKTGKMIIKSEHTRNYPNGSYIPYGDLDSYYDVFCCQKGTALPSDNQTKFTANGVEYSFPHLTMADIGKTIGETTTSGDSPFDASYNHRTIGLYKIESTNKATPEEAYILSEMIKVDGMGEYNPCQNAWWNTEAGSEGNSVTPEALSLEAKGFENYIKQVSGITKAGQLTEGDCKYTTAKFKDIETGENHEIENAFDFEYKPEWRNDGEYSKPTVMYDETSDTFTVGPFALHYVGTTETYGDREQVQFAGITGMELYTDALDEPLTLGTDWEIICAETVRCDDVDYEYPKSDETFYIKLNYIDEATQITNIKTHFRYMNAAGMYQKLQGKYFEATWTMDSEDNYDDDGDYEDTTYWLELTNLEEHDSQKLALGLNGSRWYEYMDLDRSIGIRSKSIRIVKEVVDSNGDIVKTRDFFDFKVNISGAINSGSEKVRVRANSSVTTKTYYWLDGSPAPTYDVEEIVPDGYEQVEIENESGTLGQRKPIVVRVKNTKDEHNGKIEIVKKIENSTLDSSKYSLVGKQFKFKLTVSGTFRYDGKLYRNSSLVLYPEVTAVGENEAGKPWTSNNFTWTTKNAPTFEVEEIEIPAGAEHVKTVPSSGTLKVDDTVKVETLNRQKVVSGSIDIIKKLENYEFLSEKEINDLKFHFTVHVDGYDDLEIEATAKREQENDKYIWVWRGEKAPTYTWLYGNEPNFTVTEHDNPVGTEFVTANSPDVETSLNGSTISGTLKADEAKDFEVDCNFINRVVSHKGNLELTKTINDADVLKNRDYAFVVTINGKFKFANEPNDVLLRERTIQFANDSYVEVAKDQTDPNKFVLIHIDETNLSNSWSTDTLGLGQIEWYGNEKPTYVVEENLAGTYGENVDAHTITPSRGTLEDGTIVKVKAENYSEDVETGRIRIIKTLENADKYDAGYINSLKFTFRVEVEGHDAYNVTIEPKRVDNKFVWEYESDEFVWKRGEKVPSYTIEEINIPEGVEFVSAKGPDGSTVSGTKITGTLKTSENSSEMVFTDNYYINKLKENTGNIIIKKDVTHDSLKNVEFKFTLKIEGTFTYGSEEIVNGEKVIENISVVGGSSWTSDQIKWYGEEAPKYSVVETESDKAKNVNIINGAGTVAKGTTVTATFVNGPIEKSGRIKIHKIIKDQPVKDNDRFTFRITVDGYEPYEVSIKADETFISQDYKWYASQEAPKYKVEEVNIPKGVKLISISNAEGVISDTEDVTIEAVNQYEEHRGKFVLNKVIVKDKITPETMPTFEFDITVTGQFTIAGQETTTSEIWTEHTTITGEGSYTSPDFIWYGDEPPVVNVTEKDISQDGAGWILEGISNNNSALSENETIEITATNRYEPLVIIDLTFQMAGTVWNDRPLTDDKNMEGSTPNGKLDNGEIGIDGVEVYIYKAGTSELATIYSDMSKNEITQPIITANGGKWDAPRVPVLKDGSYDVKFVYDGQTYEPTTPLVSGSASEFRGSSNTGTSGRSRWLNDSMADDINRDEVNQRLSQIKGNTPIDGAGNTTGTAVGANGNEATILYEKSSGENENRITSKAITLDENKIALDLYKAEATTSKVGLTYPFDQRMHLENFDITPTELGPAYRYLYSATYPYTLHINLGLVNREIADMDAIKDLVDAKVIVNERLLTYKFNKLADVGKDVLSRESYINATDGNNNIQYQLGFYKTDYYYRAEMYKASEVYDYMDTFYKSIGQTLDATNLEVYLKYRISVYNESPSYNVTINEIADYFDSSFGTPINTEIKKYVQTIDGKETNSGELETVARSSYVDSTGAGVTWNVTERGINGSDGITYNKMTTDALKGMKLASGEKAEIYVYFKVQPTTVEGIKDTIELANKSNIVEITNYSTYEGDRIAGKIDVDSAPDNINIINYNEKPYYEDDTDSAPVLKLVLDTENGVRSLSGYAWEDKAEEDNNTATGNGIYDEGKEALIGGLTTELVEKIKLPTGENYTEYDFLWPTNENLSCLGGRTLKDLTGFDSTTETSRNVGSGEKSEVGSYKFTGIPVGNYSVRFIYGNNKAELEDTFAVTGDPIALNPDATKFSEDENILVANYGKDAYGTTPAVYNGQDFKATLYQIKNNNDKTEWHSLRDYEDYNKDSDFIDDEARRLETMAYSRVITNVNGNVLATANAYNTLSDNNPENYIAKANHEDLYRNTFMTADTAKINFNIEKLDVNSDNGTVKNYEIETIETAIGDGTVRVITNERKVAYEVNDIALGLIARPENRIVLDKEIKTIKLTTNDNRVIFDAEYDINYKVVSLSDRNLNNYVVIQSLDKGLLRDKYLVAEVVLSEINSIGTDVMQAINKNENKLTTEGSTGTGTQNFRFVNIDDTILQGTTIELGYKLTALNVGDIDTVSQTVAELKDEVTAEGKLIRTADKMESLAQELRNELRTYSANTQDVKTLDLGKYVGRSYYTGNIADDAIVPTRVRQLVDYIDTDGTFTASYNNTENHSWKNTTINELLGDGYERDRLVEASLLSEHNSVDKNGIQYITKQRNNIVLSIDNYEQVDSLNNSGFEQTLYPFAIAEENEAYNYKSEIALTVTKTVSAEDDADNLAYDNIAEIIKYENFVGRRDEATIPGNANPEVEQFEETLKERDESATELVTFTPPTGLRVETGMTLQILFISGIALVILAVGVVIIKKTVLK